MNAQQAGAREPTLEDRLPPRRTLTIASLNNQLTTENLQKDPNQTVEFYAGEGSMSKEDSDEDSDSQETHQRNAIKNECIILDTNPYKTKWDLWVVIVLLFVAFTLPWRIAFYENDSTLSRL